jgi:hypothetical protein
VVATLQREPGQLQRMAARSYAAAMDIERVLYVRKPRIRQQQPKRTPLWLIVAAVVAVGVAIVVGPLAYAFHQMADDADQQSAPFATTPPPIMNFALSPVPGMVYCGWGFTDTFTGMLPDDYAPKTGTATLSLTTNVGLIVVSIDRSQRACAAESTRSLVSAGYYNNVTCAPIGHPAVAVGCGRQDPGYSYGADGSDPLSHLVPDSTLINEVLYECKDFKPNGVLRGSLCRADGSPEYPIEPTTTHRGLVALVADADGAAGGRLALEYATGTLKDALYPTIGQIIAGQELLDQAAASGVPLKIISAAMA